MDSNTMSKSDMVGAYSLYFPMHIALQKYADTIYILSKTDVGAARGQSLPL